MPADLDETPQIPTFRAVAWSLKRGRLESTIRLENDVETLSALVGRLVMIDDGLFRCIAIASEAHPPPFRAGEMVTLSVTEERSSRLPRP